MTTFRGVVQTRHFSFDEEEFAGEAENGRLMSTEDIADGLAARAPDCGRRSCGG
jgi:hypothetical protein